MKSYMQTGRQACKLSPYHQALHAQAVARAECMLQMRAVGFDDAEIARRFCTSEQAIKRALKRHAERKTS